MPKEEAKDDGERGVVIEIHITTKISDSGNKEIQQEVVLKEPRSTAQERPRMEIKRDRKAGKLWLSQKRYIHRVLEKFSMLDAKAISTLLASHFVLSAKQCPSTGAEMEEMVKVSYANAVGCLMLYVCSVSKALRVLRIKGFTFVALAVLRCSISKALRALHIGGFTFFAIAVLRCSVSEVLSFRTNYASALRIEVFTFFTLVVLRIGGFKFFTLAVLQCSVSEALHFSHWLCFGAPYRRLYVFRTGCASVLRIKGFKFFTLIVLWCSETFLAPICGDFSTPVADFLAPICGDFSAPVGDLLAPLGGGFSAPIGDFLAPMCGDFSAHMGDFLAPICGDFSALVGYLLALLGGGFSAPI
ncbi:hypothetical protein EZV62_014801 [Acer yangbiense]|uniref:Reverse transcriptase Ty1/copia-type domain-containing protein n=1 Tax=Acer yangbiense TaxID=1000413 RepID=A0A5C7HTQ9_9ROSI|nr:hypothetical protein EZV62_014801 [Acer yangbiense]